MLEVSLKDSFKFTIFPKFKDPLDTPVTKKTIDFFISSLYDMPSETHSPSPRNALMVSYLTYLFLFSNLISLRRVNNLRMMVVLMLISGMRTCPIWMNKVILLSQKIFPQQGQLWNPRLS